MCVPNPSPATCSIVVIIVKGCNTGVKYWKPKGIVIWLRKNGFRFKFECWYYTIKKKKYKQKSYLHNKILLYCIALQCVIDYWCNFKRHYEISIRYTQSIDLPEVNNNWRMRSTYIPINIRTKIFGRKTLWNRKRQQNQPSWPRSIQ